jgi:hypothetical protein
LIVNEVRFHELIYVQRLDAVKQNVPAPSLLKGTEIAVQPEPGVGVTTAVVAVLVAVLVTPVAVLVGVLTTAVAVLAGVPPPLMVIVPPCPDGVPMLL